MSLTVSISSFILVSPEVNLQSIYYVGRENSASLYCQAKGYPTPKITWTTCNYQENVCDKSILNISKVQRDDVYICTATNSLGSDSASTKLGTSVCHCAAPFMHHLCHSGVSVVMFLLRLSYIFNPRTNL